MGSRINGAISLAELALDMAEKLLKKENINKKEVTKIVDTVRTIPWSREVLQTIKSHRVNKFLQMLRNTKNRPGTIFCPSSDPN